MKAPSIDVSVAESVAVGHTPTRSSPASTGHHSWAYADVRPRKRALNATWAPATKGGPVSHGVETILPYHRVAMPGSLAWAATSARGTRIWISFWTSTTSIPFGRRLRPW